MVNDSFEIQNKCNLPRHTTCMRVIYQKQIIVLYTNAVSTIFQKKIPQNGIVITNWRQLSLQY